MGEPGVIDAGTVRWPWAIGLAALVLASSARSQAVAPEPASTAPVGALVEAFAMDEGVLRIVLPRGALTLRPSEDGQVWVGGALAPGQRLRQAAMPGGRVLRLVDDGRLFPAPATLDVRVPAALSLSIDVEDAGLDLEGVGGSALRVDGGQRPIRLVSSAAQVRATSRAGRLELLLSGNRLDVASLTGDIELVAPAAGVQLRVESVAGALDLRLDRPGPMRIETVSGRIAINTAQGDAPVSVETVTGDIDLRLARDTSAALKFEPGTRPLGLAGGLAAAADGLARVGDGGWTLRLATLSGRLTVRQGGAVLAEPEPDSD